MYAVSTVFIVTLCGVFIGTLGTYMAPLYTKRDVTLLTNGKYIVKLTDDVDVDPAIEEIDGLLRDGSHIGRIDRVFKHVVKGFTVDLHEEALETIRRNPKVEYIEEDVPVRTFVSGTDHIPWGLDRIDQRDARLDNGYHVEGNGTDVNVYVVDTGIKTSHEEFGIRASIATDTLGGNGEDCAGHGTHCAGIIGGSMHGVAKGVNLFAIRTMDCSGLGSSSDVIEALEWIGENGVLPAVASISLGTSDGDTAKSLDRAVEKLIEKGVTVVAAAGNEGVDACNVSPAKGDKVITVGATQPDDTLALFSNMGRCVDILAPGVGIESTWYTDVEPYKVLSGTSMACPHVTGAVAILLSKHPHLTPKEVKEIIVNDATRGIIQGVNIVTTNALLFVP